MQFNDRSPFENIDSENTFKKALTKKSLTEVLCVNLCVLLITVNCIPFQFQSIGCCDGLNIYT